MSYALSSEGAFIIEDYSHAKVFSNFFPGVAGLYGIPMWAFFVNRGQAISSFGIESKDKAILEFQPANKAYRLTSIQGFRTFLKVSDGKGQKYYEPFANSLASPYKTRQRMIITSHDLTIEEINTTLGLKTTVNYFTLPDEPYAALVRRVTFENTGKKNLTIECIDGLPAINAYGLKDWLGKHISRTVEAWVAVRNTAKKAPFYQFKVEVADTPQVTHIEEGNFYFAFDQKGDLLDPIVEAACIFGQASDFLVPENFYGAKKFSIPSVQQTSNRTPSAMVHAAVAIKPGQSKGFTALSGFAHDLAELNSVVKKSVKAGYIDAAAARNQAIIDGIKSYCFTHSSSRAFDQYCGQTFLDNVLRGGLPISLQTAQGAVPFNVYSRKHGDLERDYNFFTLAPTFLSQGNGNYRDVNQNRRNDVWFNQNVGHGSIVNFMNLSQADGYNPLVVKGLSFAVRKAADAQVIVDEFGVTDGADRLKDMLIKGFMPGDLIKAVTRGIKIKGDVKVFLARVLSVCQKQELADFGEGYWSDHWAYNLDLIESYLGLYPERLRDLLIEHKEYYFYLNDAYVLPRDQRYVVTPVGVRQYHSLAEHDKSVQAKAKGNALRVKAGAGDIYHTNLLVKILCVLANKAATLDPSGIGVEMEANKPNWYDALNGLPGLLGSSINETFEIKRWAMFTRRAIDQSGLSDGKSFEVFAELADFIQGLTHVLSSAPAPLDYWKRSNDLKEHYRKAVRLGIDGTERPLTVADIKKFLDGIIAQTSKGIQSARDAKGLFATYYYHEVSAHDVLDKSSHGEHHARPTAFKRHDLPYFLEGFVHGLRVEEGSNAAALYNGVKKSPLYDKALGMYKVNIDLSKQTEEIGRTRIFPSGWLENESVWLHMEYKYLLELLRRGLNAEFFTDAQTCFIPFLDPKTYGRSILENSSFIASSAHEDKNLHGQGFVARLSGSTAEFIHMWLLMNAGLRPFGQNADGQLTLNLKPVLPGWLFTSKADGDFPANSYAFKFLNAVLVVYHNAKRQDTFGPKAVGPVRVSLTYEGRKMPVVVEGGTLTGEHAADVRRGAVKRVDIVLE